MKMNLKTNIDQEDHLNERDNRSTVASQLVNTTGRSVTPKTIRNKMKNTGFQHRIRSWKFCIY